MNSGVLGCNHRMMRAGERGKGKRRHGGAQSELSPSPGLVYWSLEWEMHPGGARRRACRQVESGGGRRVD